MDRCFTVSGVERVHVRWPGKLIRWFEPDGTPGLGGVRLNEILPWSSERLADIDLTVAVMVTEGEPAAASLLNIGIPTIATFGAMVIPTVETLKAIAPSRNFILWPDEDAAGWIHMITLAPNLYAAGAAHLWMLAYRPKTAPRWPEKHDAADFIAAIADPSMARTAVAWLVEEWAVRIPRVSSKVHDRTRQNRFGRVWSSTFHDGSISAALRDRFGIERARPGRTIRCPRHDDRHASLSILADDRRAICKSLTCTWSSPGVTARDIEAGR